MLTQCTIVYYSIYLHTDDMKSREEAEEKKKKYSGSNKCPNVCMFSTKVDTPQHLLTRVLTCECIE
jgi:hypothetical protein